MKLILLLTLCAPLVQTQVLQPQGRGTPHSEAAAKLLTITAAENGSPPISVAGAVKEPLTFQASGPVTLLEAITRAGGLTPVAGSVILVGKTQTGPGGQPAPVVRRVSVKALIDLTDPEVNLRLSGGE